MERETILENLMSLSDLVAAILGMEVASLFALQHTGKDYNYELQPARFSTTSQDQKEINNTKKYIEYLLHYR